MYTMKPNLTERHLAAIRQIRNWIVHHGRIPSTRELMRALDYRSPRSATVILSELTKLGVLKRNPKGGFKFLGFSEDEQRAQTVDVPLIGQVACGVPILANENIEAMIPVSINLARPPHRYYLLKAKGDSMNRKKIKDGDLVLVRHQNVADNGQSVVALVDDEATIKEFHRSGEVAVLKPKSSNPKHRPIILTQDFQIQGVVVATIPKL